MLPAGVRRNRRFRVLAFALYALFLTTAQFEHHDLACHIKTPQHCSACASSPLSPDPYALKTVDTCRLAEAGSAVAVQVLSESAVLVARSTGRSPPAAL